MNPKTIDLLIAVALAVVGVAFLSVGLTWVVTCAIWFVDDFDGNPDLVMERVVMLAAALLFGLAGHYCIERARQVWRSIP